jgi:YVTN family beta-propeller protein
MSVRLAAAWLCALAQCGCSCEMAPSQRGSEAPAPPPLKTGAERVYVSNELGNSVTVIDSERDRAVAMIPVGKHPRALRVSGNGKLLFVALSGSPRGGPAVSDRLADGIGVVDLERLQLTRVLTSGPNPQSFDLTPDGRALFVSTDHSARAALIDVTSGRRQASVAISEEPDGVAVRPDGKVGYVTAESANRVDVVDLVTKKVVRSISTARRPRSVLFTRDGTRAYVSGELGRAVDVIDARAHRALRRIPIRAPEPVLPMGLALSPDERTLFVTTGRGGSVVVIDLDSGRAWTIDAIGTRPWGIAVSKSGKKLYTANGPSNDVSVIDARSGQLLAKIRSGASPWAVVVGRAP